MRPTFGSTRGSFTTRAKSTMRPPAATNCPQSTHNPTHLPRWADSGLSPMSTPPNTVARISPWVLLRRSRLGTHRITRRRAALRRLMSPRSISFQVEPESSTVVHRSRYGRCTHRGDAYRDTEKPLVRPCCGVDRRDAMDVATTTVGLTDLKFRLVREDFADAVAWVARNLPTRWLDLVVVWIEGTLWTWRRQQLVSPI